MIWGGLGTLKNFPYKIMVIAFCFTVFQLRKDFIGTLPFQVGGKEPVDEGEIGR